MRRILLLLDQKENQQLLADELSARHEVSFGDEDASLEQDFDLCVVDGHSLDRLREQVHTRKTREQPSFLPVLLVTSRPDVKMITRQLWQSIDELIIAPIERAELRARVEILLRARSLSLALQKRANDAEKAARTRDEVLAVVAHDLRNPLNLVMTNGVFLLETVEGLDPRSREQLQMIRRAAVQMDRLIQDLLEVAGMEAGNIAVEPRPVAVEPMMRDACDLQAHAAKGRGVVLACSCGAELPPVLADHERIQQVFGNLIGNALKFTPNDGQIHVHAERGEGVVRFSVSDTGTGIHPEDLPHVFDRFWQAKRSRKGGAGLGLAISRGIVLAHGGELWVESEPGQGSAFRFTLPVAGPDGPAADSAAGATATA